MQIKLNNLNQQNIIIFDIEYDQTTLVQIALLILKQTEPNIYELQNSLNLYIQSGQYLNGFFTQYTNINQKFLNDNGTTIAEVCATINELMYDFDLDKTLIVSHGVENDLNILSKIRRLDLNKIPHKYCTYQNARKLLHRDNHLTLKDVAAEGCYYMFNEHNAYADVWGTLHAFAYLNNLENKE